MRRQAKLEPGSCLKKLEDGWKTTELEKTTMRPVARASPAEVSNSTRSMRTRPISNTSPVTSPIWTRSPTRIPKRPMSKK